MAASYAQPCSSCSSSCLRREGSRQACNRLARWQTPALNLLSVRIKHFYVVLTLLFCNSGGRIGYQYSSINFRIQTRSMRKNQSKLFRTISTEAPYLVLVYSVWREHSVGESIVAISHFVCSLWNFTIFSHFCLIHEGASLIRYLTCFSNLFTVHYPWEIGVSEWRIHLFIHPALSLLWIF